MISAEKSLARLLSYLLILLISVGPFFGFVVYKVIGKEVATIELFLSLLIIALIFLEKRNFKLPLYLIVYLFFILYTIISDKYIVGKDLTLKYFRENLIFIGFLILLIIENTEFDKKFFKQILTVSYVVIIIAFIVILIQELYDNSFFVQTFVVERQSERDYARYKLPSIYSYYTVLMRVSLCFSPILALLIGDELSKSNTNKKVNERKVYFLYIIGLIFSFLSRTRILLIFYVFTLFLYFKYKGFTIQSYLKTGVIIILAIFIIMYVGPKFGLKTDQIIEERILEKETGGLANSSRILAFKVFKQVYIKDKIIGKGRYSLTTADYDKQGKKDINLIRVLHGRSSQIHVGYLALIYWYGIIGAGLFIAFLIIALRHIYLNAKKFNYWGPFIGWIIYLVFHFTDVSFDVKYMGTILIFFVNKCMSDLNSDSNKIQ